MERRVKRVGKDSSWKMPDLILVDGGKAQLSAVERVLKAKGIEEVDVASIAKSRSERGRVVRGAGMLGSERIFRPDREEPVVLPEGSPAMHLLQKLRDEAHRFAIGYHRQLRRARSFKTGLEEIPGIGPKRRRALLEHFGSLKKLREASVGDIAACPLITPTQAEAIHSFFHEGEGAAIPDEGASRAGDD
jgi:excinuclease ABC subunit C